MERARRIFMAACLAPLCAFSSFQLDKKFFLSDPTIQVSWIDVAAPDLSDVDSWLHDHGPEDVYGVKRYAVTQWSIKWKWPVEDGGVPRFDLTTAAASIKMKLPRWMPSASTSTEDRYRWNKIFQALLQHEYDHARQAIHTARLIERAIRHAALNKELTNRQAHLIARRLIRSNNEWDINYDKRTRHGRNQGVNLVVDRKVNSEL